MYRGKNGAMSLVSKAGTMSASRMAPVDITLQFRDEVDAVVVTFATAESYKSNYH